MRAAAAAVAAAAGHKTRASAAQTRQNATLGSGIGQSMQSKLQALTVVGRVLVARTPGPVAGAYTWVVTFVSAPGALALLTVTENFIIASVASVTVARLRPGTSNLFYKTDSTLAAISGNLFPCWVMLSNVPLGTANMSRALQLSVRGADVMFVCVCVCGGGGWCVGGYGERCLMPPPCPSAPPAAAADAAVHRLCMPPLLPPPPIRLCIPPLLPQLWKRYVTVEQRETTAILPEKVSGRYLRVQLPGSTGFLSIAEVEVYSESALRRARARSPGTRARVAFRARVQGCSRSSTTAAAARSWAVCTSRMTRLCTRSRAWRSRACGRCR